MSKILIVDGDNYAGRLFFINKVEDENGNINVNKTIIKTITSLSFFNNLLNFNSYSKIIFTFDTKSGKNNNKELLDNINNKYNIISNGYKGNRKKTEEFSEYKNIFQNLVYFQGFDIYLSETFEADDVIATLANYYYDDTNIKCIDILSNDKDLYQILNDKVFIVKGINHQHLLHKNKITYETIMNELHIDGLKINNLNEEFVLYKSIIGDQSDNIKGVVGVAKKTMQKEFLNCNNIFETSIYINNNEYLNELFNVLKLKNNINFDLITHYYTEYSEEKFNGYLNKINIY